MADEIINIRYKHIHDVPDEPLKKHSGLLAQLTEQQKKLKAAMLDAKNADDIKRINAELEATNTKMRQLTGATDNAKKSTSQLGEMMQRAGQAFALTAIIGTVISLGKEIISVTANFQKLAVTLENALGSKGQAAAAMAMIKDFAATTPFQVDELAESFVKLVNRGFIPTKEEMTKIGDLAASQGKSFDQLTEAILDAQTGEFERLKEFGVRATKANGEVTVSFKDQTLKVKENDEAIRNAIISLGALQGVSGGMEMQSKTLGGAISNLTDNVTSLFGEIGEEGSPALVGFIGFLSDVLSKLDPLKIALSDTLSPLRELGSTLFDVIKSTGLFNEKTDGAKVVVTVLTKAVQLVTYPIKTMIQSLVLAADSFGLLINKGKELLNVFGADFTIDKSFNVDKIKKDMVNLTLTMSNPFREIKREAVKETEELVTKVSKKHQELTEAERKELEKRLKQQQEFDEKLKQLLLEERIDTNEKLEKEFQKELEEREKQRKAELDFEERANKQRQESEESYQAFLLAHDIEMTKRRQEAAEKEKEKKIALRKEIAEGAKDIINNTVQFEIDRTDDAIKKQEDKVKAAEKLAEKGNIAQLKAEQERLDELTKKRENFVKAQKILSAIEFTANMAIAISKAAAEGGGLFSMATIGAVLAAVAGGISQVSGFVNGFEKGGFTGTGNRKDAAGIVHKEEFVFDANKTAENRDFFEAVHAGKIKPKSLFKNLPSVNMVDYGALAIDSTAVTNEKLDNIYKAIKSQQGVSLTFDENGFHAVVNHYIEKSNKVKSLRRK